MSYMKDADGNKLDAIEIKDRIEAVEAGVDSVTERTTAAAPDRPAFTPVCWYDASALAGANGDLVIHLPDKSGRNNDMSQSRASAPSLVTNGLNGHNVIDFAVNKYLIGNNNSSWNQPATGLPYTFFAVCKARSGSSQVNYRAALAVNNNAPLIGLNTVALGSGVFGSFGAGQLYAPPRLDDDAWHIIIAVGNTTGASLYLDGHMVHAANSNTPAGSNALATPYYMGGSTYGFWDGQIAECGILSGPFTMEDVEALNDHLASKWGLTSAAAIDPGGVVIRDITDANGQSVRLMWSPDKISSSPPLVIANHQQGGTNALVPTDAIYYYAPFHNLARAGYVVAIPTNHGTDSWSSATAVADGPAAEAAAKTYFNITNFSRIVLVGYSMGGALAAVQAKSATFVAPLKGVYLIDAAVSLYTMYQSSSYVASINTGLGINAGTLSSGVSIGATSINSSVSFSNGTVIMLGSGTANVENVTVNGTPSGSGPYTIPITAATKTHASSDRVSDYPTKALNRDPVAWSAGYVPTGLRWREVASSADTFVNKTANTDAFDTLLGTVSGGGVLEHAVITHSDGHLAVGAWWSADILAFANRCV